MEIEPDVSRDGLWEIKVASLGISLARGIGGAPFGTVDRYLNIELSRLKPLVPVNDQPPVLSFLLEVDEEPLGLIRRFALPDGGLGGRQGVFRGVTRKSTGGMHDGRQAVGVITKPEAVEPNRALAARTCCDHQLNGRHAGGRPSTQRSPAENDLAAPDVQGFPLFLEVKGFDPITPHVLISIIHQFEFEDVGRSAAAEVEPEGIGFWDFEGECLSGNHEASAPSEVEIQAHGAALEPLVPADPELSLP